MMDATLLRTLRTVLEEGTVLAAAQRLGYTPSAVSQQLSRLREQSGAELFVRRGRGLQPTEAAHVLARAGAELDILTARTRAQLDQVQGETAGTITLSAFPSALRGIVGRAASALRAEAPRVHLQVHEAYPEDGVRDVVQARSELAIVHEWEQIALVIPPGLRITELGTDQACAVLPASHPLAGSTAVRIEDLPGERWITDATGIYGRWLPQALAAARLPCEIAGMVDEHETQIALVAHGLGIALVPRLGQGTLPPGVRTVLLADPVPRRRVLLLEHENAVPRPALSAVREAVIASAHQALAAA